MVVLRRSLVSSLEQIPRAAPDRILGLTEQFARDTRRQKVNLTVGVYKDGWGQVTTFPSVARAQKLIDSDFELNTDLSYLPITGCRRVLSSGWASFAGGGTCKFCTDFKWDRSFGCSF